MTGKIYHVTFAPPPAEVAGRLTTRSDDTEEKARNRLSVHARNVGAVVAMYDGLVREVDGNRDKGDVFADVRALLEGAQQRRAAGAGGS